MPIAALRAFDLERIAKPNAGAAAAPMARHLAFRHVEMPGHGTNAEILVAADARRRRGARLRKTHDLSRCLRFVVIILIGHLSPVKLLPRLWQSQR